MPKRKSKTLYIDTNVILGYAADKEDNIVVLMRSIKSRKWKLRTSTFAIVELSEYKRNEIYLWEKLSQNKSLNHIIKSVRNPRDNKKLKPRHFNQVEEWLTKTLTSSDLPKIEFLDLTRSGNANEISSWEIAKDIGINSNLNAKDVIHLATAIASAKNNECDFFITCDGDLYSEAHKLVKKHKLKNTLKILKPSEFIEAYPPVKKAVND